MVIGGGHSNKVVGDYSSVLGGLANVASGVGSCVVGGRTNSATGDNTVAVGGQSNEAAGHFTFVGAGHSNTATGHYSATLSGINNHAMGYSSAIGGGAFNTAGTPDELGGYSVVAGGFGNHAKGHRTGVLGGFRNSASGTYSTIGGGEVNHALGDYSFVAGGTLNTALGVHSSVLGSYGLANHNFSAVLGFSGEVCEAQGPTTGGSVTVCTKSDGDLFVNGRGILAELTAQAQLITELTAALTAMQEQAGFDPTSDNSNDDLAWQIGVGVGAFVIVALAGGIAGWCIARRNKRMKKFSMNKGDFDYIVAERLRERGRSTAGHEHRPKMTPVSTRSPIPTTSLTKSASLVADDSADSSSGMQQTLI
eukprot:INCI7017.5.p1 GENE.INCI7017.5~~INCI7017.5.p1  ORF type:complete len:365 (+),score=74.75 INCI7017.5:790-1884(+)